MLALALVLVALLVVAAVGGVVYARWRYGQVHRIHVAGLVAPQPGKPYDLLLVALERSPGADGHAKHSAGAPETVQAVTLLRLDPATQSARMIAIPPQMAIDIPAGLAPSLPRVSSIASAINKGPGVLVATLRAALHLPISYYAAFDISHLPALVDALGGVHLDFPRPLRDSYSGLDIANTGCQLVGGAQALALTDSAHLYYFTGGTWRIDHGASLTVIDRQAALFAAIVSATKSLVTNPVALNDMLAATVSHLTTSQSLSESKLYSLAETMRGFTAGDLAVRVLPVLDARTRSGSTVITLAAGADRRLLRQFVDFGSATGARPASPVREVAGLEYAKGSPVEDDSPPAAWDPVPC